MAANSCKFTQKKAQRRIGGVVTGREELRIYFAQNLDSLPENACVSTKKR